MGNKKKTLRDKPEIYFSKTQLWRFIADILYISVALFSKTQLFQFRFMSDILQCTIVYKNTAFSV